MPCHLDSAVGDIAGCAVVRWIRGTGGQEVVDTRAAHTCNEGRQVFWLPMHDAKVPILLKP